MKTQFWALPADGARITASRICVITASGTGSGFSLRSARAVRIASRTSSSVIAGPSFARTREGHGCDRDLGSPTASLVRGCRRGGADLLQVPLAVAEQRLAQGEALVVVADRELIGHAHAAMQLDRLAADEAGGA